MATSHVIDYQPHPNTLTKSGKRNFNCVKDALAELCDNSIQSTEDKIDRQVKVIVSISRAHNDSYIIVWDNGRGMDVTGIRDMVTYHYGRQERGLAPKAGKTRMDSISKFGVGGTEAGFFIGSSMSIVTRSEKEATTDKSKSDALLEFTMDEEVFKERWSAEGGCSVYKDTVKGRLPIVKGGRSSSAATSSYSESDLPNSLKNLVEELELETSSESFTYVALKMRRAHSFRFYENGSVLTALYKQIAHTFNYFINPENLPPNVAAEEKRSNGGRMRIPVNMSFLARGHATEPKHGEMQHSKEWKVVPLSGEEASWNLEQEYVMEAGDRFDFDLMIRHENNEDEETDHAVHGIIRYYPHDGAIPTLPNRQVAYQPDELSISGSDTRDGDSVALSQYPMVSQTALSSNTSSLVIDDDGSSISDSAIDDSIVDIFWQGRLVPQTLLQELPFFPKDDWCNRNQAKIGPEWRNRIHGAMFFQWEFPISNNKLRLNAQSKDTAGQSSLKDVLRNDGMVTWGERPDQLRKRFQIWLEKCHTNLDKELHYSDCDVEATEKARKFVFLTLRNGVPPKDGNDKDKDTFQKDDRVLIYTKRKSKNSRGAILGTIIRFEVPLRSRSLSLPALHEGFTFDGGNNGEVLIQRAPRTVWGDTVARVHVSQLETRSHQNESDWNEKCEKAELDLPKSIRVLWSDSEKKQPLSSGRTTKLVAGVYPAGTMSMTVFLENGHKKPTEKHPDGKGKWVVTQALYGPDKKKLFWHECNVSTRNKDTGNFEHSFTHFDLKYAGEHVLKIKVRHPRKSASSNDELCDQDSLNEEENTPTNDESVIREFTHRFKVVPSSPTKIEARWLSDTFSSNSSEFTQYIPRVRLGLELPGIEITALDEYDNVVSDLLADPWTTSRSAASYQCTLPVEDVSLRLSANDLKFVFNNPSRTFESEASVQHSVEGGVVAMVTPVKRDDLDNYVYVCGGEESEGGFWRISPTAAGMLGVEKPHHQPDGTGGKEVMVGVHLVVGMKSPKKSADSANGADTQMQLEDDKLNLSTSLQIVILPGLPTVLRRILQDESDDEKCSVVDGCKLPTLRFAVFDAWNNRTAPIVAKGSESNRAVISKIKKGKGRKSKRRRQPVAEETDEESGYEHENERWLISLEESQGPSPLYPKLESFSEANLDAAIIDVNTIDGCATFDDIRLILPENAWQLHCLPSSTQSQAMDTACSLADAMLTPLNLSMNARLKISSVSDNYRKSPVAQSVIGQTPISESFDLYVKPNDAPVTMELFLNKEPLSNYFINDNSKPRTIVCAAASAIEDLTVSVKNKFGKFVAIKTLRERNLEITGAEAKTLSQEVGDDPGDPTIEDDENKTGQTVFQGVRILVDGEEKYAEGFRKIDYEDNIDPSIELPDTAMPKTLGDGDAVVELTVEIHFSAHLEWPALTQRFDVLVTAGEPYKWCIDFQEHFQSSVRVGDSWTDFVRGVYLRDKHKNPLGSTESNWLELAQPRLVYESSHGCVSDIPLILDMAEEAWLVQDTPVQGLPGKGKLSVDSLGMEETGAPMDTSTEEERQIQVVKDIKKTSKSLYLEAGIPSSIVVRSESLALTDWGSELSASSKVPVGTFVRDLQFKFLDISGNDCVMDEGYSVKVKLIPSQNQEFETDSILTTEDWSVEGKCFTAPETELLPFPRDKSCKKSNPQKKRRVSASLEGSMALGEDIECLLLVHAEIEHLEKRAKSSRPMEAKIHCQLEPLDTVESMKLHFDGWPCGFLEPFGNSASSVSSSTLAEEMQLDNTALSGSISGNDLSPDLVSICSGNEIDGRCCSLRLPIGRISDGFPSIYVSLITERGLIHNISEDVLEQEQPLTLGVDFVKKPSKPTDKAVRQDRRRHTHDCLASYRTEIQSSTKMHFKAAIGGSVHLLGKYTFKAMFKETRCSPETLRLTSAASDDGSQVEENEIAKSASFVVQLVPGTIAKVSEKLVFKNFFRGWAASFNDEGRGIKDLVKLCFVDNHDNICSLDSLAPELQVHGTQRPTLRCRIEAQISDEDEDAVDGLQGGDEENVDNSISHTKQTLPRLEGADEDGWIFAESEWDENWNQQLYKVLKLENGTSARAGVYDLVFQAVIQRRPGDVEIMEDLKAFRVPWTLVADAVDMEERAAIEAKLQPTRTRLEEKQNVVDNARSAMETAEATLRKNAERIGSFHLADIFGDMESEAQSPNVSSSQQLAQYGQLPSSEEMHLVLERWSETLQQREAGCDDSSGQRRPTVITSNGKYAVSFSSLVQAIEPIGHLVDVLFIENNRLAEIVSRMQGPTVMSAIIIDTKEKLQQSRQIKGITWFPIHMMTEYRVVDRQNRRKRNDAEKAKKQLPLPNLAGRPGNPKYLINMVGLKDEHEYLRDTVVWNLFGHTLVCDCNEDCDAYREWCKREGRVAGRLISLKEGQIKAASGHETNDSIDDGNKRSLPFVFGSLPLSEDRDYRSLKSSLQTGKELFSMLQQYYKSRDDYDVVQGELGEEIDGLQSEAKELETALRKLDRKSSGAKRKKKKSR